MSLKYVCFEFTAQCRNFRILSKNLNVFRVMVEGSVVTSVKIFPVRMCRGVPKWLHFTMLQTHFVVLRSEIPVLVQTCSFKLLVFEKQLFVSVGR